MGIVATVQYLNQYKPNVADVRQQVTYGQSMAYNVLGLGEVAFVRWLMCRKAILPNPCYRQ